jgi:hypothetical protein
VTETNQAGHREELSSGTPSPQVVDHRDDRHGSHAKPGHVRKDEIQHIQQLHWPNADFVVLWHHFLAFLETGRSRLDERVRHSALNQEWGVVRAIPFRLHLQISTFLSKSALFFPNQHISQPSWA